MSGPAKRGEKTLSGSEADPAAAQFSWRFEAELRCWTAGDGALAGCVTVVPGPNFLLKYSVNSWISGSVRLAPQPTILSISRFHPAADNRCSSMRRMP